MSSPFSKAERVAVLIATCDRPRFLARRSLPSVFSQKRLPDRVILVDDSDDPANSALVRRFIKKFYPRIEWLKNRRTKGLSGALNSGLAYLLRSGEDPDALFVSLLDDDDAWCDDHLEACLATARAHNANMVASGLIRFSSEFSHGHAHSIPGKLDAEALFIAGTHIQGSNLFLTLNMLLKAGMFDEHLPSCTDRDICIRLSRQPRLRFASTAVHTVRHYADDRPDRLSSPGGDRKRLGLDRFWKKHAAAFSPIAREKALERGRRLFNWKPAVSDTRFIASPERSFCGGKLPITVGFITDADPKAHVRGLLDDLFELSGNPEIEKLRVVILENGPRGEGMRGSLEALAHAYQRKGMDIQLVSLEQQRNDWERMRIPDGPNPFLARRPIPITRTILNAYLMRAAGEIPGSAVWVLDDDKRLKVRVGQSEGDCYVRTPNVRGLLELKNRGVNVVIGPDTDAAPLPFLSTLRVQLLDLEKFLFSLPNRSERAAADFACGVDSEPPLKDSHYDLSRSTEHLETPLPLCVDDTVGDANPILAALAEKVDRLLAGEPLFRPLRLEPCDFSVDALRDSIQRGGSAIFFNAGDLAFFPHKVARMGGRYLRRSDMMVSLFMRELSGLRIVMHPFAGVSHDRSSATPGGLRDETLGDDMLGHALYRALEDVLCARAGRKSAGRLLEFTADEVENGCRLTGKYLEERLTAFLLNSFRVRGLCESISAQIKKMEPRRASRADAPGGGVFRRLGEKIGAIHREFDAPHVCALIEEIQGFSSDERVRDALRSMDGLIYEYRSVVVPSGGVLQESLRARESRARALIAGAFGVGNLEMLGAGGEGIVLTDGRAVYKVLDIIKRSPGNEVHRVLCEFKNRLGNARFACRIRDIRTCDGILVISYAFERSEPYAGGHGGELIGLLREFKSAGFVFRNMHPDNLRVTENGLRLIDVGADIRPYSEPGFRSMAERAWLTWRWHHRGDLHAVMRRALENKDIPELDGFDRFWTLLNAPHPSATKQVHGALSGMLRGRGVRTLLDYGCGKHAWSVREFAKEGMACVGYDIDFGLAQRWKTLGCDSRHIFLTNDREEALRRGPYDAVISSLVLCRLGDGEDYERVLSDIRASLQPGGTALLTLCNPLSLFGKPTQLHPSRDIPERKGYADCFWYREGAPGEKGRDEYHRPLHRIKRDLARHGLTVRDVIEHRAIDIERFEPASDFLTLVCARARRTQCHPSISLVIKTCAMEHRTIERQVGHLLSQLEGPHIFGERILLLDSRTVDFTRQYAAPDRKALERAAGRLLRAGLIDRILCAPADDAAVSRVMTDWFALPSGHAHTGLGAPLCGPLYAFERCVGEYILQVDSDLLIHRSDLKQDYLSEMIGAIERDPKAVTASLSVARRESSPPEIGDAANPWRVESRGCLLHRDRLLAARPLSNAYSEGIPTLSWHRSLDESVKTGSLHSLRGRCGHTWFAHPENTMKACADEWMLMLDLFEGQSAPSVQFGNPELQGGPLSWVPKGVDARYVFIVTGRNVPAGRMARCIDSMLRQSHGDWGAVIIDDASDENISESLRLLVNAHRDKMILLRPRERRGQLANMALAIRHVCTNPESVMVTLDLDDCLIGPHVLDRLSEAYGKGADLTVGSMLRTDKHKEYPVTFDQPRRARGGNLWQHLRSFKKRLFDRIPDHFLRLDGTYVDVAVDWSYMLPLSELAEKPVWIRDCLYLHEPSGMGKGGDRAFRENQIARIVSKPDAVMMKRESPEPLILPGRITGDIFGEQGGILFIRHDGISSLEDSGDVPARQPGLAAASRAACELLGRRLGALFDISAVSTPEAIETAAAIVAGSGMGAERIERIGRDATFAVLDRSVFQAAAKRMGREELMQSWMDGLLRDGVLYGCHGLSCSFFRALQARFGPGGNRRILAVVPDFVLMAVLASVKGLRAARIPPLAGTFVNFSEISNLLSDKNPHAQ